MRFVSVSKSRFKRINPMILVSLTWILGLLLGSWFAFANWQGIARMVAQACVTPHSVFFAFLNNTALFGSVFLLYRYFGKFKVLPIVLLKAFLLSICGIAISHVYGSAGWLVSGLLLFSDFGICFVLLLFSFRILRSKKVLQMRDCSAYFGIALVMILFDHFVVSPFLRMLFT